MIDGFDNTATAPAPYPERFIMASSTETSKNLAVSFIGAGAMGIPMAIKLLENGHSVSMWNRTLSKCNPVKEKGAKVFSTPDAAVRDGGDIVFIMLSACKAIQAVLGNPRVLESIRGKTVINMSTIAPDESEAFAKMVEESGGTYVESPVSGSVPHVQKGSLLIMACARKEKTVKNLSHLLSIWGTVKYLGNITASATYKIAINQMLAANTTALAFSLGYIRRSGLDTKAFMDIIQGGILSCPYYNFKYPAMRDRKFTPTNFSSNLFLKDVNLAIEDGKKKGLLTASVEGVAAVTKAAIRNGLGNSDFSSLYNAIDPPSSKDVNHAENEEKEK
eukprot:jgi/Bigna1/73544/fgenesh1_pg.24_\